MQRALQLARDRVRDAADAVVGGLRDEQHDLPRALHRRGDHRGQRARGARAGGALGGGEDACAPVVLGRREVVRAHDDHGAAARQVDPELLAARDEVAAVGHVAPQDRAQEVRLRRLGSALGRTQALDLGGDQGRDDAQQGGRRLLARAPAQPQPADHRVADPQLVRDDAGGVGHQRALVRRGARGDREHPARAVDQDDGGVERAGRGAHHLGEPEAALDRLGDGVEAAEVRRRRHPAEGLGHPSKSRRGARARRSTRGSPRRARSRRARTLRGRTG